MTRAKIKWAVIALVALTLGGLVSLYQVLFDLWMTAYPFANVNEWRTRLYIRLATTIVTAACWSVLAIWLYRHRRHRAKRRRTDMTDGHSWPAR